DELGAAVEEWVARTPWTTEAEGPQRDADELGLTDVWAVPPDDGSALATAVRDRLTRAAVR
ncbi:MAG: hypothetical protein WBB41_03810, partial [Candidatus Nanopelagicales bacterium]